jgi:hypothetical protein
LNLKSLREVPKTQKDTLSQQKPHNWLWAIVQRFPHNMWREAGEGHQRSTFSASAIWCFIMEFLVSLQFDAVRLADSCGGAVGWSLTASIDRVPSHHRSQIQVMEAF